VRQGLLLRRSPEENLKRPPPTPITDPYRPLSHHAEGSVVLGSGRGLGKVLGCSSFSASSLWGMGFGSPLEGLPHGVTHFL
jgi:hypothetical protein